jgi:hypothetical protein
MFLPFLNQFVVSVLFRFFIVVDYFEKIYHPLISLFFFRSLFYEGMQMAQSRYLFALSCFQLDLLKESEAALCPANEPGAEVCIGE